MILSEAREELGRADQKASILLAAALVTIGAVVTGIFDVGWTPAKFGWFTQALWWLGVIGVISGVGCLAAAVVPRWRPRSGASDRDYFGDIRDQSDIEQMRRVAASNPMFLRDRVERQLIVVGAIVRLKYLLIQAGLILLGAGGLMCLIAWAST